MLDNEERVQKEVSEILRISGDHPVVVEITDSLLDEYPELKIGNRDDIELFIKHLDRKFIIEMLIKNTDDEQFDRFLNKLLPNDGSGKKSKKRKPTKRKPTKRRPKRKPKKRKTRRGRK